MNPFRILLLQISHDASDLSRRLPLRFHPTCHSRLFARILYILSLPHFSNSRLSYLLEAILQVYNHV